MAKKSKARRDIEDLVGSYGDAVTRRDNTLWRSLWAEDATWILGDRTVTGIAAVFGHYENLLKRLQFAAHVAFPAANRCCCSGCTTIDTAASTKSGASRSAASAFCTKAPWHPMR